MRTHLTLLALCLSVSTASVAQNSYFAYESYYPLFEEWAGISEPLQLYIEDIEMKRSELGEYVRTSGPQLAGLDKDERADIFFDASDPTYFEADNHFKVLFHGKKTFAEIESEAYEQLKLALAELSENFLVPDSIFEHLASIHDLTQAHLESLRREDESLKTFHALAKKGTIDTLLLSFHYIKTPLFTERIQRIRVHLRKVTSSYFMISLDDYDQAVKTIERVKKALHAVAVRMDNVNGDGVYYIKPKSTLKWGVVQYYDNYLDTIVSTKYDSVGVLQWNAQYVVVKKDGKVGLHAINFGDEAPKLLVPCAYDAVKMQAIYYENETNFAGYACMVKQGNKWGFVHWQTGEILSEFTFDNPNNIQTSTKFSYAR
jgi:hypothetical protein